MSDGIVPIAQMRRLWLRLHDGITVENAETLDELREALEKRYAAPRFLIGGWNR